MFSKLLGLVIGMVSIGRYYFWKIILYFNGSSLGKNVTIQAHVKLVSNRDRPIYIGDNVKIMQGVIISTAQKGKVCIGSNVYIGEYSVITSNKEIRIEDNVMIAPHNNIVDFDHRSDDLGTTATQDSFIAEKIEIKGGSWLAANCCVLKGVAIGPNTIIGAGSVVTECIPAYSVAVGSPASVVKKIQ